MITFLDWIKSFESSPTTRNKWNAALGLQPMYSADVFGHSTPPPWQAERLLKKLKKSHKKKKRKKRKE
jgi:hypothetical protein